MGWCYPIIGGKAGGVRCSLKQTKLVLWQTHHQNSCQNVISGENCRSIDFIARYMLYIASPANAEAVAGNNRGCPAAPARHCSASRPIVGAAAVPTHHTRLPGPPFRPRQRLPAVGQLPAGASLVLAVVHPAVGLRLLDGGLGGSQACDGHAQG